MEGDGMKYRIIEEIDPDQGENGSPKITVHARAFGIWMDITAKAGHTAFSDRADAWAFIMAVEERNTLEGLGLPVVRKKPAPADKMMRTGGNNFTKEF